MSISPHFELIRLRAELALVQRMNAGYGFADRRIPAEVYLRDDAARERLGRSALRPKDTHADQRAEIEAALEAAEASWPEDGTGLTLLCDRFGLDAGERALLEIAVCYQLDRDSRELCHAIAGSRAARLYADVTAELAPELADVAELLRVSHPSGRLRRNGLVDVDDDTRPATSALSCSRRILDWLLGDERIAAPIDGLVALFAADATIDVHIPEAVEAAAAAAAERLDGTTAILIEGPGGSGKRALAQHIAASIQRPLLAANAGEVVAILPEVLREARMRGAVLYLAHAEALADNEGRAAVYALNHDPGPVVLSTRRGGRQSLPIARAFQLVHVPQPNLANRRLAWSRGLDALDDADLGDNAADALATRYVVGAGVVSEVVAEARAFAAAKGAHMNRADIEEALGRQLSIELGSFGHLVTRRARFDEMVLPDDVLDVLRSIIAMVRERTTILESWGYGDHLGISRGVSALFSGEPGTGKTMAASVISGELGLELMRIDLSSVVSKWVGETEKHLAKIFDEAQSANAMLLFDEADSLFGKRTEAKSAQDRYANLEVNYVLQRMETFDGISILTSNMENAIDPAFLRRINFRVRFPEPDIDERAELWRRLLPPGTNISDDADFDTLAERFEMTGGHIRNAIVRAAVIAARDERPMRPKDLIHGAHLEYEELGKVMPTFE